MNKITQDILRKPEDLYICKSEEEFHSLQFKWSNSLIHAYDMISPSSANLKRHSIIEAYNSFSLAAADGNADAQFMIAMFTLQESLCCREIIPLDVDSAVKWLEKAASHKAFIKFQHQIAINIGVAKAENALGNLVRRRRVNGDDKLAYDWFRKSAEHGSPAGQNNLALCLLV